MRIASNDPRQRASQTSDDIVVTMNVSFTGDAISHLSTSTSATAGINLNEWVWHEQIVNGERYYVITDKITSHPE